MKIRNPFVIKTACSLGSSFVYLLGCTIRVRIRCLGEDYSPDAPNLNCRAIYLFWHDCMLLPSFIYARPDIHVLVSQHTDGVFIGDVMKRIGFSMAYGSSMRGGFNAIRQMLKLSKTSHFAITPDGPRGPRRQLKMGAVFLAAQTGMPIVPVGCGYSSAWRAKSWDRFACPRRSAKGALFSRLPSSSRGTSRTMCSNVTGGRLKPNFSLRRRLPNVGRRPGNMILMNTTVSARLPGPNSRVQRNPTSVVSEFARIRLLGRHKNPEFWRVRLHAERSF